MKNTDYKDVLDIGNEALSMDNKFSFSEFPSLKTAFTIGENIRGMSNVSPLATVKLFNQSTEDLQKKYYPDGNSPVEGTFTYIPDNRSDLTSVIKTTVKDFYYYGVQDVKNFAFKVIIFSSTETTKLKECFEVSSPKGREILIFVEDNSKDNVSGTYGAIKISEDVITFLNSKKRLAYDVYDNTEIYKEIKAVVPELTDDQIKSLLQKGYIEDTRIDIAKTYFKVASFFSSGISLIHPSLGILTNDAMRAATSSVLQKVIETIEEARLEENRWQPRPPRLENGKLEENYQYKPLISSGKNGSGTVNFTEISRYLKTMLAEQNGFVKSLLNIKKDFKHDSEPKGLLEILYKSYLDAYYIMHDIASNLENISEIEILKYGAKVYNALLCGIWNGLIDAVAGLFAMVKMIYDGITLGKDFAQNIDKYLPTLLEQFDEAIQSIKNIDFIEIVKYIYGKLKEIKLTFDPIACGYFIGYAYGFIISLIIEIIVGALVSGGTLSIPIIIQKLEETIFGIFRLGWGLVKGVARKIRTFSKFVVKSIKNIIDRFQELLRFLKGENGNFKQIINDLFTNLKTFRNDTRNKIRSNYFNSIADPVADILGPASRSHPERLKQITLDLKNKGVELIFRSDESLGYAPGLSKGKPGQIIVHENASISAWEHEYVHFLDDQENGFLGMSSLFDVNYRVRTELNAYTKEINFVKSLNGNHDNIIRQLKLNFEDEFNYIVREFDEVTDKDLLESIKKFKNL